MDVLEYVDAAGRSPFGDWFDRLGYEAAAKITTAIVRLGLGNTSNVKGVGTGVFEVRLDFGPGYRIYFGKGAAGRAILLGGGTKQRQRRDVLAARIRWAEYRARRSGT